MRDRIVRLEVELRRIERHVMAAKQYLGMVRDDLSGREGLKQTMLAADWATYELDAILEGVVNCGEMDSASCQEAGGLHGKGEGGGEERGRVCCPGIEEGQPGQYED